jgi:hypothetical protein
MSFRDACDLVPEGHKVKSAAQIRRAKRRRQQRKERKRLAKARAAAEQNAEAKP